MAFSVVSWNIEFFGSKRRGESRASVVERIDRVFDYLTSPEMEADVIALYEVNGSQVFNAAVNAFPDYSWQITEGTGAQLILVGSRIPTFTTVRHEFSSGFAGPLRPGVLSTVRHNGTDFPILFLHLKAADVPIDFGVRNHQHDKARSLRKALDRGTRGGQAPFIVTGDFNNVGLNLSFSDADVSLDAELDRLDRMYGSHFDKMPLRSKTHAATFWNGTGSSDPPSDIDHVVAASNVAFRAVNGADVEVKGWPEQPDDAAKTVWINDFSDHAALRFTVDGIDAPPGG